MYGSPHVIQVSKYIIIALLGTMLIPKKEDLQAACLNETKCPYMTTESYEQTLATLPLQSKVPSRMSHNLPKARSQSFPAQICTLEPGGIVAITCPVRGLLACPWFKTRGKKCTPLCQPNHNHSYITDKSSC